MKGKLIFIFRNALTVKLPFQCIIIFGFFFSSVNAQTNQGFSLNDFVPKKASIPTFTEVEKPTKAATVLVSVDYQAELTKISNYLVGNNANIYMTQMVDQPILINHLTKLAPKVLRFPGGTIGGLFFWNASKNQPPTDAPAQYPNANGVMQNAGYWFGKNSENWTLSVDNYYSMLATTNSTGIITVNYDYARYSTAANPVASAAHLAADWVRYDNGRTKYWEVGNESNGDWQPGYRIDQTKNKDGQPLTMTGALYGEHFKVFADSMRKAAHEVGAQIYIGAQLLEKAPSNFFKATDKTWNAEVYQRTVNIPDYYIIHSYYTPYNTNSPAIDILNSGTTNTKAMMDFLTQDMAQAGVTPKPIALTEWNIFAVGSKQQPSFINGMHGAIVLGELIKNKYGLACRWDLANAWENGNDHGLFSQGDDPDGSAAKWNPRATFYYLYYFQKFLGDQLINTTVSGSSDVIAYASKFNSGEASVAIINKGLAEQTAFVSINHFGYGDRYYVYSLTGGTDNGEFSLKVNVNGQSNTLNVGGPANYSSLPSRSSLIGSGVKLTLPPRSVQYILIENGLNVITGIDPIRPNQMTIYPNPAGNNFTIELPSAGYSRIEIYDINGRSLFTERGDSDKSSIVINANLSPGIYQVRVFQNHELVQARLIIK